MGTLDKRTGSSEMAAAAPPNEAPAEQRANSDASEAPSSPSEEERKLGDQSGQNPPAADQTAANQPSSGAAEESDDGSSAESQQASNADGAADGSGQTASSGAGSTGDASTATAGDDAGGPRTGATVDARDDSAGVAILGSGGVVDPAQLGLVDAVGVSALGLADNINDAAGDLGLAGLGTGLLGVIGLDVVPDQLVGATSLGSILSTADKASDDLGVSLLGTDGGIGGLTAGLGDVPAELVDIALDGLGAGLDTLGVNGDLASASLGNKDLLANTPLSESNGPLASANILGAESSQSDGIATAAIGSDPSQSLIDVDAVSNRDPSVSNSLVDSDIGPPSEDAGVTVDFGSNPDSSASLVDADAGQTQGPSLVDAEVGTAADQFQFPALDGSGIDSLVGEVGQEMPALGGDGGINVLPVSATVDGQTLIDADLSGDVAAGDNGLDNGTSLTVNAPFEEQAALV